MEKAERTFEQLLVDHQGLIRKICRIYGKSRDDQEDLFQEITIQLWRSFSTFRGESKFATWLYRIALNTAITFKRKEKRRPPTSSLSEEVVRMSASTEEATDEEALQSMHWAIRQLQHVDRAIIFLYLEEKSYAEIAEIIGITPKYVGVKIVRIKAKLLDLLTRDHGK